MSTRRRFMEALGASFLISAPPLVRQVAAAVAPGPAPKRFMVILLPNAIEQRLWIPEGGLNVATGSGDAGSYRLNTASRGLEPVRPWLTLVDGIDIPGTTGDLHGAGCIGFMCGEATGGDNDFARGPSIDQLLTLRSPMLRGTTFPSLPLACDTRADLANLGPRFRAMSFNERGGPIVGDNAPAQTYARLFGAMGAPGATEAERNAAMERARAINASVLDFVRGSLDGLKRRLPAQETVLLDQHLEGIRELERTITAAPPAPPVATLNPGDLKTLVPNDSKSHGRVVAAYLETVKLALQLDLTRVSSLMLAAVQNNVDFSLVEPGFSAGRVHYMSHEPGKYRDALAKVTSWYIERIAGFVQRLADTPDRDGTKLIDNTMVMLFTECTINGNNPHKHTNVPVALLGGSALGLKGNRCLRYGGRNSNELMVPVARAFGVQTDTFGKRELSAKPLTGLI